MTEEFDEDVVFEVCVLCRRFFAETCKMLLCHAKVNIPHKIHFYRF